MKIDWFTVVAQVINFLVLVWLLRKFLYRPILEAIKDRETKISSQLLQAEEKSASAEKERMEFQTKNESLAKEYSSLINEAASKAAAEGKRLLEIVRKESDDSRNELDKNLGLQQKKLETEFLRRGQHQFFDMLQKVIKEIASANLEDQVIEVFIKRINGLEQDQKEKLKCAISKITNPVLISTSFVLSIERKKSIENVVQAVLNIPMTFNYKESMDLICGIELSCLDYRITWSISDYINTLEKSSDEVLDGKILSGSI